ncbi:unnamed protein product [marine sediment metagenome]|uniref:Uncharacterized protein n=1 Tax=marine sediment metagenome TaxID=412755 RepID=X1QQC6_9ZZZZ
MNDRSMYEGLEQRIRELEKELADNEREKRKFEKAAHKFRTIFNSLSEGLAIMDKSLTVKEVNEYRLEVLGLDRGQGYHNQWLFSQWKGERDAGGRRRRFYRQTVSAN